MYTLECPPLTNIPSTANATIGYTIGGITQSAVANGSGQTGNVTGSGREELLNYGVTEVRVENRELLDDLKKKL
jgi:hypothetical protein